MSKSKSELAEGDWNIDWKAKSLEILSVVETINNEQLKLLSRLHKNSQVDAPLFATMEQFDTSKENASISNPPSAPNPVVAPHGDELIVQLAQLDRKNIDAANIAARSISKAKR